MTLIAVYNSEGCVGRCDARCYDAKHSNCDCICGGRNHGKGKTQAVENTKGLVDQWAEKMKETPGIETKIHKAVEFARKQINLF
jgi:hypothetical protein